MDLPIGTRAVMGVAFVNESGRLQLGSNGLLPHHLPMLAGWTARHAPTYPGLARLKNARLIQIDAAGVVVDRFEEEALWSALPDPVVPGTLAETASLIEKLRPGRSYWFWMSSHGPGGQPFLLLGSQKRDADGSAFAQKVQLLRRRIDGSGPALRGILRIQGEQMLLVTTQPLGDGPQTLARLQQQIPALGSARLLQMGEGGALTMAPLVSAGPDLSRQSAALQELTEETAVLYWFTDAGADGSPLLLLDTDSTALRVAAKAAAGAGTFSRGKLLRSPKGWPEFRTRQAHPDFVATLAAWVSANITAWPELARLNGARLVQRDENGEIVDRQKNPAAWASLNLK
ncbi:MAG: hypothetical protein AAFV53_14335 [Myxococcota bacterium]